MVDLDEIRAALADVKNYKTLAEWEAAELFLSLNAPTWLAALCTEVERLRELSAQLQVEQDAALAEVERLRAELATARRAVETDAQIYRAWRECADQLAACFEQWMLQAAPVREALAEYEKLKAGES